MFQALEKGSLHINLFNPHNSPEEGTVLIFILWMGILRDEVS